MFLNRLFQQVFKLVVYFVYINLSSDLNIVHISTQVFKDGRKSTLNIVSKHNVYFVSVLWVDSCKQTWSRVSEEDFPATKTETGSPLANMRGKIKRLKSLQPKAFDEDLNDSGSMSISS